MFFIDNVFPQSVRTKIYSYLLYTITFYAFKRRIILCMHCLPFLTDSQEYVSVCFSFSNLRALKGYFYISLDILVFSLRHVGSSIFTLVLMLLFFDYIHSSCFIFLFRIHSSLD